MKKILIIEDDEALVELMGVRLRGAGYEVRIAPDAILGTKMAMQAPLPDLILLDLKMPAGGGAAVLKSLRTSVHTRHVPVVIMTAASDPKSRQDLLALGIKTYIQKPFEGDELLRTIESLLPS